MSESPSSGILATGAPKIHHHLTEKLNLGKICPKNTQFYPIFLLFARNNLKRFLFFANLYNLSLFLFMHIYTTGKDFVKNSLSFSRLGRQFFSRLRTKIPPIYKKEVNFSRSGDNPRNKVSITSTKTYTLTARKPQRPNGSFRTERSPLAHSATPPPGCAMVKSYDFTKTP